MTKKFIAGGCSFTFGHELSDDHEGRSPSKMTWAHRLKDCLSDRLHTPKDQYVCTATPGSGNSGIARRVFEEIVKHDPIQIRCVVVMWSFLSRYDWAMPRHRSLENTRWASISPWDTNAGNEEAFRELSGSETQQQIWTVRRETFVEAGVQPFAEAIYKHAANQYHETYLSWKSIIWLQNILEKKEIPYMFTLADNGLFYEEFTPHKDQDAFMTALHSEIDFTKWFSFGERMMGFNQWALLNDYRRGTTHPLDEAHADAVKLMLPTFEKLTGGKR
jgi:hypothetical protein